MTVGVFDFFACLVPECVNAQLFWQLNTAQDILLAETILWTCEMNLLMLTQSTSVAQHELQYNLAYTDMSERIIDLF